MASGSCVPSFPPGRAIALPGRGTTFVHEISGPPGAPTLVLLHGWTATAALNWFACFEPLGRYFRVLALDHRGHGRGIQSRRPFRLEDCADDVAALAEALGVGNIIPVGYSMGGPIAQLTWRRHPDLVRGLVLCATARRFSGRRPTDTAFTSGVLGLSLAAALSPLALRKKAVGLFVGNRFDDSPMGEWAAGEFLRNDPVALLQAGLALRLYDARPWLPGVDVPTAVVVTTGDTVVSPVSQLALADAIPGSKIYRVDGDHSVCAERPQLFTPILIEACRYVARQRQPRRPAGAPTPLR